jgi:hypothetical protein
MKNKKWLDGKQQYYWPIRDHIGWSVCTAGWVDLDLEPRTVMFNDRGPRRLPPGSLMILKDIDDLGYAYTYDTDHGVMRFSAELLEPWQR